MPARIPGMDVGLAERDRFQLGDAEAEVFETPGHTSGHISYWFAEPKALFCADTLFSLGCGRLLEGTPAQMWRSLSKFAPLPDDARVYCAHEYTQANARFALSVDPDNPALQARAAEVDRLRAAGQPTVPSTLGAERAANPVPAPARPGDPSAPRAGGRERRRRVRRAAQAQGPLLSAPGDRRCAAAMARAQRSHGCNVAVLEPWHALWCKVS